MPWADVSLKAIEVFLTERNNITFFDGVVPTLQHLSQRYKLGALSNGNADINRLGLDAYFSFAYSAEQVGAAKPEPHLVARNALRGRRQFWQL